MSRKIIGVTVGTSMNPQKIIEAMPAGKQVQGDWSVNDENDSGYIKNRTHYEVTETIEWDGNTEGLPSIQYSGDLYLYHISDKVYSNEELQKAVMTTHSKTDGNELHEEMVVAEGWDSFIVHEAVCGCGYFMVVRKENFTMMGTPFPNVGLYFLRRQDEESGDFEYTSKLVVPSAKRLDEKFIPDTICRKDYVDQKMTELQTVLGTNLAEVASLVGGDA